MFISGGKLWFCKNAAFSFSYFISDEQMAFVKNVIPKKGSLNGGTRITVYGKGFAKDQVWSDGENCHEQIIMEEKTEKTNT